MVAEYLESEEDTCSELPVGMYSGLEGGVYSIIVREKTQSTGKWGERGYFFAIAVGKRILYF